MYSLYANTRASFECHTGTNKWKKVVLFLCVYFLQGHFAHLVTRCEDMYHWSMSQNVYQRYVSFISRGIQALCFLLLGITASYFCFVRDNPILSYKKISWGDISLMIPEVEFLDINLRAKGSSLLLHTIHSPFYWRMLKLTILFSGLKNPYKENPRNNKTWVYSWIEFCRTEKWG